MIGSAHKSLSLVQIMGGVRLPPHTALLKEASQFVATASFWIFLIAVVVCWLSDGTAVKTTGPLAATHPHPRYYGTFPRVLGRYVRDEKVLTLEEAIRKMTSANAAKVGIYDRGLLQPGLAADLVIFDPDTVNPGEEDIIHDFPNNGWRIRELAEGIYCTIVNGQILLEGGEHVGSYPGRVLRNALYHMRTPRQG